MSMKKGFWPNISEFDIHRATRSISDYIEIHYKYKPDLKYYVDYMKQYSDDDNTHFIYEVKWSTPTKVEPLQKATASIYFIFRIPKVILPDSSVQVTYVYECTNQILKPGQSPFRERWIRKLIQHKMNFIKLQKMAFHDEIEE